MNYDAVQIDAILKRLVPDKAQLLVEAVRSLGGQYTLGHGTHAGYVDWFVIAKRIGMHWRRAEQTAAKFDKLGLQDLRNNYDGWVTWLGVGVALRIDPTLPDKSEL